MIIQSQSKDIFEILKPVDVELLLAIDAVVSKSNQSFIIYLAFLLQETVNSIKQFVRNSLHLWASIGICVVDIESVLLCRLVVL